MVVYNPSIFPPAPGFPTQSAAFQNVICSLNYQVPNVACQPAYAPTPIIQGASMVPPSANYPTSPVVSYSGNISTTPMSLPTVVPYDTAPATPVVTFNAKVPPPPSLSTCDTQSSTYVTGDGTLYTQPVITLVPVSNANGTVLASTRLVPYAPSVAACETSVCPNSLPPPPQPTSSILRTTPQPPVPSLHALATSIRATMPSWNQSYGMEQVWRAYFYSLFSHYLPHSWILEPANEKPPGIWNTSVDSAKVRFSCDKCGHGWTSMKGRAIFWFILSPLTGEGIVCLKLYGQQCDKCKGGRFESAMWYPEEVKKVVTNIYHKIGQVYYGFHQLPSDRTRRAGRPRTAHNSDLCQACKDGICSERK